MKKKMAYVAITALVIALIISNISFLMEAKTYDEAKRILVESEKNLEEAMDVLERADTTYNEAQNILNDAKKLLGIND